MKKIVLIVLIILAFLLRFYKLDAYPALNADEASNAYDAYSLLQTGQDQHGRDWPLSFQSFNDFKPGLYVYLSIPLIKLFGLNEWSARAVGASFGVLSVYLIYLFVKELFKSEKLALVSALFLAISPWHIHYSRGGWEVNLGTSLILAGSLFLFKGINNNKAKVKYFAISAILFALSFYAYHASRVIVPLIGLSVYLIYTKKLFLDFKPIVIFFTVGALLVTPLVFDLLKPGALSRAQGVGLFADKGQLARINEQRGEHLNINSITTKLAHNKIVNYGLQFFDNWAMHYNGEFLFMSGDSIERNKVPETGQLYLFDMLFLGIGLISMIRKIILGQDGSNEWRFIFIWLMIAPIASALTFQSPNALRSQNMVIPLMVISAHGLLMLGEVAKKVDRKFFSPACLVLIVTLIGWNFVRYEEMYWKYMSKVYPYSSQYGVKELVTYITSEKEKFENIFVTTRYDQPYILFLFYSKYDPRVFQQNHALTSRDEYGFSTVADFSNFHFGPIDFESFQETYPDSLVIGTPEEIPQTSNIIKRVYGTNSFEYFDIVEN